MIPTTLIVGAVMGLLPGRWPVIGVLASGVAWMVLLFSTSVRGPEQECPGRFRWSVQNAGVAALVVWSVKRAITIAIFDRTR